MRILIWLLLAAVVVWLFRASRRKVEGNTAAPKVRAHNQDEPTKMVTCELCGVHVPSSEALIGKQGSYCCALHHQQAEP